MENVPHALTQAKSQLMEFVFQLNQPVLKDNTLTAREIVLMLIFFVKLSKRLVENVLSVFGDMKTALFLENVSRSFAHPDMFLTISENVLESAIFVRLLMLVEIV